MIYSKSELTEKEMACVAGGAPGFKTYTVKPGDTLASIDAKYKITEAQLMEWNNLYFPDNLYHGQTLVVGFIETGTNLE